LTFLGPSGSGKSTTLYAIAGFQDPSSGDVLLEDRSLLSVPSHKRNIGMVFQRYTLFPHLSVAENVAFPLRVRRRPDGEIKRKVADMLAAGASSKTSPTAIRAHCRAASSSAWRLPARSPTTRPILLMDTSRLSAPTRKLRQEFQAESAASTARRASTILYVTHDQEEALHLSDRIALFREGRIEQIGTGEDLYLRRGERVCCRLHRQLEFPAGRASANRERARQRSAWPTARNRDRRQDDNVLRPRQKVRLMGGRKPFG